MSTLKKIVAFMVILLFSQVLFAQQNIQNPLLPVNQYYSPVFGDDIVIDDQPDINQENIRVACAFNGDLYAAYSYYKDEMSWLKILKSDDKGSTWTVLLDGESIIKHVHITNLDIIAAGNTNTDLRIFIGTCTYDSVNNYQRVSLSWFDTTGYFGNEILQESSRKCKDLAIASDYMYPAPNSNPYSIAAIYSKNNVQDTIWFRSSSDGGYSHMETFRKIGHTTKYFDKVSLAYGRSSSVSGGRYFAAWEEKENKDSPYGHIFTAHSEQELNGPFTLPVLLDTISGSAENKVRNPTVACQFSTTDNDSSNLSEVILCDKYDSLHGKWDVIGFYNKKATSSNKFQTFSIDSGEGNKTQPDITFNPYDSTFIVTYFDSTKQTLPYLTKNFNLTNPSSWVIVSSGYNDNANLLSPHPRVDLNQADHTGMNVWIGHPQGNNGVAFFDAPNHYYTGIAEHKQERSLITKVYPVPASNDVTIEFELPEKEDVKISILSPIGMRIGMVQSKSVSVGKHQIRIDLTNYTCGNYIYRFQAGVYVSSGTFVVIK